MLKNKISSGIFYALASVVLYSSSAALVKLLSKHIPTMEIVFFRGIVSLVIVLAYMLISKEKFKITNKRFWILRGSVGALGQVIYIYMITTMKLADMMTITFIVPIFVALFARIFLKEKLSPWFFLAFALSMIGALLVVKPGFQYSLYSLLLGLTMTMFAGSAYVTTRFLARNNSVFIIVLSFIIFSLIYSTPFMIHHFVVPTLQEVFLAFALGTLVTGAMITLAKAYADEKTSSATISMISYFKMIFALVFGFLFWGELPDYLSIIGSVIIIASTLLLRKRKRRAVAI